MTTTPLSDADSGRGGTVADSQEYLNRGEHDKHVTAHTRITGRRRALKTTGECDCFSQVLSTSYEVKFAHCVAEERTKENLLEEKEKRRLHNGMFTNDDSFIYVI